MKIKQKQWLIAAVAWFAMSVYTLIFREASQIGAPPFPHFDKVAHALLFLVQTWLGAKFWLTENREPPYLKLFFLALIWAVTSELAQHIFATTRQGDIWDVAADMLGVIMALKLANLQVTVNHKHL